MSLQDEINKTTEKLNALRAEQARCQHEWLEPIQAGDIKHEPKYENRPMGSDFFNPVLIGSEPVEINVWRRTCTKCGLVQTTTKTEPVPTAPVVRPVF